MQVRIPVRSTFAKQYPECAAFKTAYTLASALAVYRLDSRKPKALSEQERATGRTTDEPTDQTVMYQSVLARGARHSAPKQGRRSAPEEQHSDQDKCRENHIPDKVHPMDALTATKPGVFVIEIKPTPAFLHLLNQPRQKSSVKSTKVARPSNHAQSELCFQLSGKPSRESGT